MSLYKRGIESRVWLGSWHDDAKQRVEQIGDGVELIRGQTKEPFFKNGGLSVGGKDSKAMARLAFLIPLAIVFGGLILIVAAIKRKAESTDEWEEYADELRE